MTGPSFLDQALFSDLAEKAAANPRGRQHHNFHAMEEPCHRMAVALQPSTYVPPHRHLSADKAETLLVLKGRLGVLIFDEAGQVKGKRILQAGGDCVGVDLPAGVFHGLVALEADSLMFECKAGPYRPVGEGEQASWAPREGEPGVAEYQAWMRAQFD
ncbi:MULTISPECIES: WbuC family cupin fold metalloprotein [Pseudomonas]|uniref:WbuC family cupin fold metalloprotein n=1 Tax=Pseudomonas TaxID=286 RepID=UPI0006423C2D|nr:MULTISPECIES: WbuC family cupin fold metalloprotein [Pseudomonas]MDF2399233.1 cupin fold metalloprotein, WbuC family [Pseudomonas sp. 3MA1]MDP9529179.1 WbuC family cupin fold metalloprotein [Pseudomonas protegens]RBJ78043.1 cupin fold metalloprotein, WbuC family [Pseudomonas sp. MWU12-2534b]